MKKRRNSSIRASALQIAISTALISVSVILLAIAAPTETKNAFGQNAEEFRPETVDMPTLEKYPDTFIPLGSNTRLPSRKLLTPRRSVPET